MKRPKATTQSNALLSALHSLSSITKSDGSALETHVILANGWVTASNGIIGAGEKFESDLFCAPNAKLLESALSRCNSAISFTQNETKLSITSGPFRAQVPFIPIENLSKATPDVICGPLDNKLRDSFETLVQVPEKDEHALTASVLLSAGSAFATDRTVILEAYHGNNTPVLSIPKSFVKILSKVKKDFKGFGFSNNSFTIWFADDSWIKTQLWLAEWPDMSSILNASANLMAIPEGFWEALDAIDDFSNDGWAYSRNGKLCSHNDDAAGASYECYGLPPNIIFSINQMQAVKGWGKKIDFFAKSTNGIRCIKIVGDRTRCVIAGRREV
jgi:hypothetical protein